MSKTIFFNNFIFIFYIAIIILANLTANSIISAPLGLVTTVGTLIFGLTFTLRDVLHSQGIKKVYLAIGLASVASILVNFVAGAPLQVIFASVIAFIFGETVDTQTFQNLKNKNWLTRSLMSNFVSVPVDSILFSVLAFWATENQGLIGSFILSDLIFKYLIAGLLALGIFRFWKRRV